MVWVLWTMKETLIHINIKENPLPSIEKLNTDDNFIFQQDGDHLTQLVQLGFGLYYNYSRLVFKQFRP